MLTSTYINTIWLRNRIVDVVRSRARDDRGSVLVEYAFLLSLIFIVCLAAMALLGTATHDNVTNSANKVQAAN
jgi:Flp pilus assembly pilin Flp